MTTDETPEYTDEARSRARTGRRVLLAGFVALCSVPLLGLVRDTHASLTFVPAQAVVTNVDVGRDGKHIEPVVAYRYNADGQSLDGSRFQLAGFLYTRARAERAIRPYLVGDSVTVYVDPSNPARSVLLKTLDPIGFLSIMFAPFLMGTLFWFLNIHRGRKSGLLRPSESWL